MTAEQIKNTDMTVAEMVAEMVKTQEEIAYWIRQQRLILEGENEQACGI